MRAGVWTSILGTALCAALFPATSRAGEPAPIPPDQLEFFEKKIRPVLVERCYSCHSAEAKDIKGELRVDSREALLKGGMLGAALIPGNPEKSLLMKAIKYEDDELLMPPKKKLSDEEIAAFAAWIKMGAPDPRKAGAPVAAAGVSVDKARAFWSFQPVGNPQPPEVKNAEWATSPIDRFVLAKLESQNMSPAPAADRRTLIRRLTFDLHGLPPTPAEIDAFIADTAPDALPKLVDRLLASPRYGERWGRHWLDVARYADTKGYLAGDEERRFPYSYTYRDYVIRAFNDDLPYDQFITHQLAADKLNLGDDKRALAALGFITVGRRFLNKTEDIIDDRIDTLTRGFQGLSVACARCHDHKFDPIPTKDYYSLYGVFASSKEMKEPPLIAECSNETDRAAYQTELQNRKDSVQKNLEERRIANMVILRKADRIAADLLTAHEIKGKDDKAINGLVGKRDLKRASVNRWRKTLDRAAKDKDPIFAPWNALAAIPEKEFTAKAAALIAEWKTPDPKRPAMNPLVVEALSAKPPATLEAASKIYGTVLAAHDKPEAFPAAEKDKEALRQALHGKDAPTFLATTGEAEELFNRKEADEVRKLRANIEALHVTHAGAPQRAMAMEDGNIYNPRVFIRGNPGTQGPEVPRQFLAVLSPEKREPFKNGSGRLDLAQSIANKNNPLTARVMVNRIWLHHFGAGIVRTPSDFGLRGEAPTHPELLDYLARQFMDKGWSVKAMHRMIALSSTYQQSCADNEKFRLADPENRLLWRMNRRRLDFEAFRDSILATAGRSDFAIGGKPVDLSTRPYSGRRTVYGYIDRQNLPGMFRTFDMASPDTHTAQRFNTTVPQQALFMMNGLFAIDQAQALAARKDLPSDTNMDARIRAVYKIIFGREADAEEVTMALEYLKTPIVEDVADNDDDIKSQKTRAWQYGYGTFDAEKKRITEFTKLTHFSGKQWQGGANMPDAKLSWTSLHASGGHPGEGPKLAVIRRWTAPRDGIAKIFGKVQHHTKAAGSGDGVQARVVSSSKGEVGSWTVQEKDVEAKVENLEVKKGDTLDFVVDCRTNSSFDSFNWVPVIRLAKTVAPKPAPGEKPAPKPPEEAIEWNGTNDFAGPPPVALTPWERYVQVLLMANEFTFID